jgi:hypothetical protein
LLSEIVNVVEIADVSFREVVAKMRRRAGRIIFEYKRFNGIVGCRLQEHSAQLSASQNSCLDHVIFIQAQI